MAITPHNPETERLEKFQSLLAGQYWRAKDAILGQHIDADMVLLIESIRWVDDAPHTIILRPHPTKIGQRVEVKVERSDGHTYTSIQELSEHRFLLNEFLERFEFEPDHQQIRAAEVKKVQAKINDLQTELLEAQSNPALLAHVVAEKLSEEATPEEKALPAIASSTMSPATSTISDALAAGITAESVDAMRLMVRREHRVATIKSEWIRSKTGEIADAIQAITPFYQEQAAAALAQTEDVRAFVTKLSRGIESLDLYVGKDVEVLTIREGAHAPKEEPLTIVQRKLMMDEELSVWADIDEWFDFAQEEKFFEALRNHDDLVHQIFPTERCVLVMAVTRRYIDYGDSWTNNARNNENSKVFLLVRNGMNIHRVFSPVESHLRSARLFPSKTDGDKIFRGVDGENIKFEDVAYTDKLEKHDNFALHYKRFLLLACGLDHRLKLFGDFYEGPQSLHFVSQSFQDRYMRFLHDDDAATMLPSEDRYDVQEWKNEMNGYLRSGARLLCEWSRMMSPETSPSAVKEVRGGHRNEWLYSPEKNVSEAVAVMDKGELCVFVEVTGRTYANEKRTFNCRVVIKDHGYLVLDAIDPDRFHHYIHDRKTREGFLRYMRFFKTAASLVKAERLEEADTRSRMREALIIGKVGTPDTHDDLIDRSVIAWRAANRGKKLPKFENGETPKEWPSLLDQMHMLASASEGDVELVEAFIRNKGLEPLRLALSGKAKLVAYAAPKAEERCDILGRHIWVHRINLERTKKGIKETSRTWTTLKKVLAAETTLHDWPDVKEWYDLKSPFPTLTKKLEFMESCRGAMAQLQKYHAPMDKSEWMSLFCQWKFKRDDANEGAKFVQDIQILLPIGMLLDGERASTIGLRAKAEGVLLRTAPDEESRERVIAEFVSKYNNRSYAHEAILQSEKFGFVLFEGQGKKGYRETPFFDTDSQYNVWGFNGPNVSSPLISDTLKAWISKCQKSSPLPEEDFAKNYWFAEELLDSGFARLDELFGLKLPENFKPTRVTINRYFDDDRNTKAVTFDILEIGVYEEPLGWNGDKVGPATMAYFDSSRAAGGSETHYTVAEAMAYMQNEAALLTGWRLLRASEIEGFPGVGVPGMERWVLLPPEETKEEDKV